MDARGAWSHARRAAHAAPRTRTRTTDDVSRAVSSRASRRADKGHTCERSRNPNGALSGADASTAADAAHWSAEDVERRMDFALRAVRALSRFRVLVTPFAPFTSRLLLRLPARALRVDATCLGVRRLPRRRRARAACASGCRFRARRATPALFSLSETPSPSRSSADAPARCRAAAAPQAYAHGTQALRTHLMSGREQSKLSWCALRFSAFACPLVLFLTHSLVPFRPAFAALRERWRGRITLQGVALVVLAYFRYDKTHKHSRFSLRTHSRIQRIHAFRHSSFSLFAPLRAVMRRLARRWLMTWPPTAACWARLCRAATAAVFRMTITQHV
jgi:hypothetical protein